MKKDRNCNMNPYPVMPNYPGVMPVMPVPNVMPNAIPNQGMMVPGMMPGTGAMPNNIPMPMVSGACNQNISGVDSQLAALNNQVSSLEKRVARLEGMAGAGNQKYNDSNFYMV